MVDLIVTPPGLSGLIATRCILSSTDLHLLLPGKLEKPVPILYPSNLVRTPLYIGRRTSGSVARTFRFLPLRSKRIFELKDKADVE